jgi:hypothetical protein
MRPPVSRSCESDLTYDDVTWTGRSARRGSPVESGFQLSVDTKTFFTSL